MVTFNWDVHLGFGQASSPDYDVFLHSSFIIRQGVLIQKILFSKDVPMWKTWKWKRSYKTKSCIIIVFFRYQDLHTKSYIMVFASQRWLGVRLDCLSALLTAATALASVIVSQDAGNYTCICNQQINPCLYELLN